MPSHLTRHVFRALLANEPIIHRGCLRRRSYATIRRQTHLGKALSSYNGRSSIPNQQRRTFFNFNVFGRRKREGQDADMDPGVEKMMDLARRQRMKARLPVKEEVAEAFAAFVHAKCKSRQSIEDTQADLLLQSLNYCMNSTEVEQNGGHFPISTNALRMTALALRRSGEGASQHHIQLVKALYELSLTLKSGKIYGSCLKTYVKYLALNGQAYEARDLVMSIASSEDRRQDVASKPGSLDAEEDVEADESLDMIDEPSLLSKVNTPGLVSSLWFRVLGGFARGNSESELLATLEMARKHGDLHPILLSIAMLTFYLRFSNVQPIRTWFTEYWTQASESDRVEKTTPQSQGQQVHRVLNWCREHDQMEYGHEVVRTVMATSPSKPVWDAILVWAASTGKGVDEIARMLQVMENSNTTLDKDSIPRVADVETINLLVEFAVSKDDPYMAERFIALGRDRGITPDARSYVLQMDYRLRVKDVDGALVAYKNLQALDLSSDEDLPTVNKLLVALCQSQRHDFDTIMNVAADLSDRQARFEPLTVSNLSILHLNRDEYDDVIDLLNTHSYHFSSGERDGVRDAILTLCLDPQTPTSRSWDAFTLIRKVFDETPRSQRTEIMLNFFRRERSDMAVHVFNSMRTHSRADIIPTIDTYVAAFVAAAEVHDLDSLEVIHNQLKLDYNINVSTYLQNALVFAYTACGKPRKALEFWDEIVASKEGPTYNSIHVALRACEQSPFGDLKAREIWNKLRRMKVELDQSLWASYVAALAGNGDNAFAFSTIEEAETKAELNVDPFLIGSFFAGGAGQSKQKEIEEWAVSRYPQVWEQLLEIGMDEDEAHMRAFRIDRTVTP